MNNEEKGTRYHTKLRSPQCALCRRDIDVPTTGIIIVIILILIIYSSLVALPTKRS